MTTAQVVETSVTNNSLSKDYPYLDDHTKQMRVDLIVTRIDFFLSHSTIVYMYNRISLHVHVHVQYNIPCFVCWYNLKIYIVDWVWLYNKGIFFNQGNISW